MSKTTAVLERIREAEEQVMYEIRAAPTRHLSLIRTQLEYARMLEEDRIKTGMVPDAS
jgi:hypothetical protein